MQAHGHSTEQVRAGATSAHATSAHATPAGLTPLSRAIVRRFVPDANNTDNPRVHTAYGQVASVVGIACNVALCLAKGAVGLLSGSVSIVADAVNNLSDASSNVVSLLGFKLARKPADDEHPYGHGRYEYLSGMVVAVLVVVVGVELVRSSIDKLIAPSPTEFGPAVVVVLVLSILVKLWMARFNGSLGRAIGSQTLRATAADSRNDVIATAAVLVSSIISALSSVDLDGWMGVAVGAFIVWSGIGLVRDTMDPLLGRAPDPRLVQRIQEKIMSYPGVLGTHDLMVHDYGPGRQFASAHVEMAAEADVIASHDTLDRIEQSFKNDDGLIMTLHYDPIVTDDPQSQDLRNWLSEQVKTIDARLTIHDLRTVPGTTHTNVIFDCVKPHNLAMSDAELRRRLCRIVTSRDPSYVCVVNIDQSYVSAEQ